MKEKIFSACALIPILAVTIHASDFGSTENKKCTNCGLCQRGAGKTTAEYYDVKRNDTLGDIAKKLGITVEHIVGLNDIENPNLIYPGQKLKVLEKEWACEEYVVKNNDTLSKIAKKYEVEIEKLIEINKIENPDMIYVGQKLAVPKLVRVLQIETSPKSYVEVSREGEIIAQKATYNEEVVEIEEETIESGENLEVKVYNSKGEIEEKKVEVSEKKVTFISFIDTNNNDNLDLDDILITDGTIAVDGKRVNISPLGITEVEDIEIGESYNFAVTSKENNLDEKKINIKVTGEKVFVPIKTDFISLSGSIKLLGRLFFTQKSDIYENLLLRIRNQEGEELLFLPVDRNGNFYIDRIVQGEYYYDIEEITNSKLKILEKNKKLTINNSDIQLELKVKNRIF